MTIASHSTLARAKQVSDEVNQRFGIRTTAVSTAGKDDLHAALADTEILMAAATAGIQVASAEDLAHARRLLVAADVNAVPPEGIAGVNVMNDGKPIGPSGDAGPLGIGALAIGNVKYQVEHRLFVQMRTSSKPVYLGFPQAFDEARAVAAGLG